MNIQTLKLSELNPAKYNPRKELRPGDAEFEKLKRSIESFGYVELIVVNEATGFTVISGHQRLSVLKALGYESVECVVVSLDVVHEKALNIAMNKISGEWDTKKLENLLLDLKAEDFDVTLTGFDTSEIGLMLGVDDEIVQDVVPNVALDAELICHPGDVWRLGRHRLLCGSSTEKSNVARLMDGQHSKLLFTSPPYSDTVVASVRAYFEQKNSTEKWRNMAQSDEVNALFRLRTITGLALHNRHVIVCEGKRYNIYSVENVKGRGMYLEVLAVSADG